MNQMELFKNALTRSVESLLNAEAQVRNHIRWLAETKRYNVEKLALNNIYNSDDICDFNTWTQKGIEHNANMKVVAVCAEMEDWNIIGKIKGRENDINDLFEIRILFLCDPRPNLSSKKKLTDIEKSILKKMLDKYERPSYGPSSDCREIMDLNRSLNTLKHGYNMAFVGKWSFGLSEILSERFENIRLQIQNVTICKKLE